MKRSGFNWLALGIESSSEHVRDGVTKGRFNNYNIKEIVKKLEIWVFMLEQIIYLGCQMMI